MFEEIENGLLIRPTNRNYFESFAGILLQTGNLNKEMHQFKEEEKRLKNRKLCVPQIRKISFYSWFIHAR